MEKILKLMFGRFPDDLISRVQLLLYCIADFVGLAIVHWKSFGYYVEFSCKQCLEQFLLAMHLLKI